MYTTVQKIKIIYITGDVDRSLTKALH